METGRVEIGRKEFEYVGHLRRDLGGMPRRRAYRNTVRFSLASQDVLFQSYRSDTHNVSIAAKKNRRQISTSQFSIEY